MEKNKVFDIIQKEYKSDLESIDSSFSLHETWRVFNKIINEQFPERNDLKITLENIYSPENFNNGVKSTDLNSWVSSFEPFLKKINKLISLDKEETTDDKKKKLTLSKILHKLNRVRQSSDERYIKLFNDNVINDSILRDIVNIDQFDKEVKEDKYYFKESSFEYHLIKTFLFRNFEAHEKEGYSMGKKIALSKSITYSYLYICHFFQEEILLGLRKNKFGNLEYYFSELEDELKPENTFVQLKIKKYENGRLGKEKEITEKTMSDLIEKNEPGMVLIGGAGAGKTTTLKYLAHSFLIDKKTRWSKIPVYLELASLTDENKTIENYISEELNCDEKTYNENYMQDDNIKFFLFLDGLNEIVKNTQSRAKIKTQRQEEIKNIMTNTDKFFVVVSDRVSTSDFSTEIFPNLVSYSLVGLDDDTDKIYFIENYGKSEEYQDKISVTLNLHKELPDFFKILNTPFLISKVIEMGISKTNIPRNQIDIIARFIKELFIRELGKGDEYFNPDYIEQILFQLAHEIHEERNTNIPESKEYYNAKIMKVIRNLNYEYNAQYVLKILIELGILSRNSQSRKIKFSHDNYFEYFVAKFQQMFYRS